MPLEDKATRHIVMAEVNRWANQIDMSLATVAVINSVVYIGGRIRPHKGGAGRGVDVKHTILMMREALENIKGVDQCVVDAMIEEKVG
jgi:hypothetical protein